MRTNRRVLLVMLLALSCFYAGFYLNPRDLFKDLHLSAPPNIEANQEFSKKLEEFMKVLAATRALYVDEKSPDELINLAMKGVVSGLDPYSHLYIGPEVQVAVEMLSDRTYNDGIGISVGLFSGYVYVTEVYAGYSAADAGIKSGDIITGVNGKKIYGMPLEQVVLLIKGKEGTTVPVEVMDTHSQKIRSVTLIRQKIKISSIFYVDLGSNAYIKVRSFNEETAKEFFQALMNAQGKSGLIIDLRNNPGGFLDQAVDMLSYLIGPDKVVIKAIGQTLRQEYRTKNVPNIPVKYPKNVTVLVNNFSASASEIMAGNLKHYKISKIIGVRTFGKAVMQGRFDLERPSIRPDKDTKFLLDITMARYYLPDGSDISSTGVTPDIKVEQADNFKAYDYLTDRDAQFLTALKFLRGN